MNSHKCIVDIDVNNIEKRYEPTKYYVYCIWVTWSDSNKYKIFRRYSQFFDLQCKLLDKFKKEAGIFNPNEREIPFLPGKKLFVRSQIYSVALERMYKLDAYCKRLIRLKKQISCCDLVLNFFDLNQNDINCLTQTQPSLNELPTFISNPTKSEEYKCIHDFKAITKSEISLRNNQTVKVLEKNFNGWWFVDCGDAQGFVPQCILKPVNTSNFNDNQFVMAGDENEIFLVKKNYEASKSDEVSIKKGDYVKVIEKRINGWWLVECENKIGIAPAVCIGLIDKTKIDKEVHKNSDSKSVLSLASSESLGESLNSKKLDSLSNDDSFFVFQDFEDPLNEGLNLKIGQKCRVLNTENDSGWWYVLIEDNQNEGWAPSAFLTKEKPKPPRPPPPKKTVQDSGSKDIFISEEKISVSKLKEMFEKKM